jgi:hypothetical protein
MNTYVKDKHSDYLFELDDQGLSTGEVWKKVSAAQGASIIQEKMPRLCACGCRQPVTSPRPEAKYASGACRVRVHRDAKWAEVKVEEGDTPWDRAWNRTYPFPGSRNPTQAQIDRATASVTPSGSTPDQDPKPESTG